MTQKHTPLVADQEHVRFHDGSLLATVWEKYPSKERLPGESWMAMMDRTAADRAASKQDAIDRARLFAAAPDLLEALQAITDQLERVGDTRQHKDGQFIEAARTAIAKATGE